MAEREMGTVLVGLEQEGTEKKSSTNSVGSGHYGCLPYACPPNSSSSQQLAEAW